MRVQILQETHGADDALLLDERWQSPSTFLYLPEKTAVSAEWVDRAIALIPDDLQRDHFALLTSGSTGEPKLVIGSRTRAEGLARVLHAAQESGPVAETIVALPLSYSYAFVNQWLWSRTFNRRLVVTDGFRKPDRILGTLQAADEAMLCLVGSQLPLFDALAGDATFPGVVRLHFAGGRFPQEQLPRLRSRFPRARVFNNYGCAEALPRLTVRKAEEGASASDVGRPIEGVSLQSDATGALRFRSAYGAVALIEQGALKRIGPDDWVPTGDLGHEGEDGRWILDGRSGDVFKRHGEKVSAPAIVTAISSAWKGIAAAYREADRLGEPGLVLVVSPPPEAAELNGILHALRESLSRPQWPLRIEALEAMPLLANGKPDTATASSAPGRTVLWRQRI
ncbi:MAG TPA: AMP-binding protein [Thermoanaerobaculia bacterium]